MHSALASVWKFIRKRWLLLVILAIAGGGFFFWRYQRIEANKPDLTFEKPVRKDLYQRLEVSGIVDAKEKARLRFLVGGRVVYLGAQEGDYVEKWQTIASIDRATLQKQLEQDLNNYLIERYEADHYIYDTKDEYWERYVVREREFNQIDVENSVLGVEIRDIAIRDTGLYAPFEGILTHSPTTVSGVQLLSTDYFEIVNPESLIIKAEIDEVDLEKVQLGQKSEITLDAYPDSPFHTQVEFISFTSNETSSGTIFLAELAVPSQDLNRYRIGMNADVSIETAVRYNALTIPLIATRERDDVVYVDVRTGEDTYEERAIKLGLETDEEVEVIEGLSESDEVLIPE